MVFCGVFASLVAVAATGVAVGEGLHAASRRMMTRVMPSFLEYIVFSLLGLLGTAYTERISTTATPYLMSPSVKS